MYGIQMVSVFEYLLLLKYEILKKLVTWINALLFYNLSSISNLKSFFSEIESFWTARQRCC